MKTNRQSLGRWGENFAANYLTELGYEILQQNARTPYGEIDLVARLAIDAEPLIVFVEVKTRSSSSFGLPEQSVSPRKQEHLLNSAQYYLQEHPELGLDWRVDVIAILRLSGDRPPAITHFENAVGSS